MKIISLNVWSGKQRDELFTFLQEEVKTTDIFCLQEADDVFREVFKNLFEDFNEVSEYRFGYAEGDREEKYSLTMYVKKTFEILGKSAVFCEPRIDNKVFGLGIDVEVLIGNGVLHILNYHGTSRPKDKLDTEERLLQSEEIASYYKKISTPKILIGDFNFLPITDSYELIKSAGYRELVIDTDVPTTRNELYWNRRGLDHKYSDYAYLSMEIQVNSFHVLDNRVSDHLPLILDFSLETFSERVS